MMGRELAHFYIALSSLLPQAGEGLGMRVVEQESSMKFYEYQKISKRFF